MSELIQEQERFTIDSDQKAEWALKKIAEARADEDRWKRFYDEQKKQVSDETNARVANLEALLEEYFSTVPHKKAKASESYTLPGGKLVLKKQEPTFDRDNEKLIPWLKANKPELVKVVEEPDWATLKKATTVMGDGIFTEDGEAVPGVKVTPRPDVFKVEVKA